jgi:hypothetical protein
VFLIAAGTYVIAAASFTIFGRTSVQSWNTYWKEEEPIDTIKLKTEKSEFQMQRF